MQTSYTDTGRNVREEIQLLNSISRVSARLAKIFQFLPSKDNPRKEKEPMSKIADMKQTIEELRSAAAAINDAADWLYQQFSSTDNSDKAANF